MQPNFDVFEESDISYDQVKEFIAPPIGNSKLEEFNILIHVRLQKPRVKKPKDDKNKK